MLKDYLLAHGGRLARRAMRFGNDRRGVVALEYAVIAGLVSVGAVAAFAGVFGVLSSKLTNIVSSISTGTG